MCAKHKKDEEAIFNEAIKIKDSAERAAFIKSACGGDGDLLVRVEALLRVHYEDKSFLKWPPVDVDGTLDTPPLSECPGTRIGRYKLLQLIGEGGFGVVYMAEQEEPILRRVALKIIKLGMDTKQVIARFEAERQALAMMEHPNIARVFDAGATDTGRPYFVMECVKGIPITEYCDRQKLSVEERLELFLQVCDGVQHAHQKGIIHRDIKPSNILVSTEGEKSVPKIIDFGVAKAISQPLTERTLFTERGQIIGTPEYMSPEQAEMTAQDIDTRSDIYSLGIMLYELLIGSLPFDRKTLEQAGFAEIQRIIREEDPPRPSTRLTSLGEEARKVAESRRTEVASLARRLHKELEWIPLKAMRKERTHRYRTASEFADDIQNYLNGDPLIAGPESAVYRVKKFVRRNRTLVTGISAVLVAFVAGIVFSTIFAIGQASAKAEADKARSIAEAARTSEAQQRQIAEAQRDRAIEAERQAKNLQSLAEQRRTEAEAARTAEAQQRQKAEDERHRAIEAEQQAKISQAVAEQLAGTLFASAEPYKAKGREVTVREALDAASENVEEEFVGEPLVEASIRTTLGYTYLSLGEYKAAEPHLERACQIRQEQLGEEDPSTLASMHNLASLYGEQGRYDEAEQLLVQTLELRSSVLGEEHPETLSSMNNLASLYSIQGRYDEAEPLYVKTLESRHRILGEEHRNTLTSMNNLAVLYREQGRYDKAEPLLLNGLDISRRVLGEEHPHTLTCMNNLIKLYEACGKPRQAEEWRAKVHGKEGAGELDVFGLLGGGVEFLFELAGKIL